MTAGRIGNRAVALVALGAVLVRAAGSGTPSIAWGGAGGVVAAALAALAYLAGRVGAGDVKLASAMGIIVGPVAAVPMIAVATAVAAAMALADLAPRHWPGRRPVRRASARWMQSAAVPLAPAIGIGAAVGSLLSAAW